MTTVTLFRHEAMEHHRNADQAGVPLPSAPPPALLVWSLVGCVVLAVAFAASGSYARKQRVAGYLAPEHGVARIVPQRAGVITAVHVHDGELTAAGAPLITVATGVLDADGADVDGAVLAALQGQVARIGEQVAVERARTAQEQTRLADHAVSLQQEHAALADQAQLQGQRTGLMQQQMVAANGLVAGGNVSRIELQRRQDGVLAQLQAAAALSRDLAAKQSEIDANRHALADLPDAASARIAALRVQSAEIETRIAEARGRQAILLRAPIAGRITALQAVAGQQANPAVPLLAIVPEGDPLRAELLVPARAIGEVRAGQMVRVTFDAFPAARFGMASGQVLSVSHSLLRPAELAGPLAATEPCYRVSVALDAQTVGTGGALRLAPDMTLSAAIVIDRRSLLGWLAAPLWDRAAGRV